MALSRMTATGFAKRMKELLDQQDVIFLLGAGCSISSGIPGAGELVKDHWLPRLHRDTATNGETFDSWVKTNFPKYDPVSPAYSYGGVMEALFPDDNQRQMEIERICTGKDPGFGYAVLARLMAQPNSRARIALTTNFDDLLFDALYLFANARPVLIHHDSLASFIRPSHRRPIVVKVHGDHLLAPKNLSTETKSIDAKLRRKLVPLLAERTVIIMGYSGEDESICDLFEDVPAGASSFYWLKRSEPQCRMREWFDSRNGTWVRGDFDEFMLLALNELAFGHPNEDRFKAIFQRYLDTHDQLRRRISKLPSSNPDSAALQEAEKQVAETLPAWWKVELEARQYKQTDPDRANEIYETGLQEIGESAPLLGSYAIFMKNIRKDYKRAEELYERAIAVDPTSAVNLGNYALFLTNIRKDHDGAEELYKRSIASAPNYAIHLGNYAIFLRNIRKDYDRAQEFYDRAIEVDPTDADNLGNYANFMKSVRKDHTRAQELYERAITANPSDGIHLANYGGLLLARGEDKRGLELLRSALASPDITETPALAAECWFYLYTNGPADERDGALGSLKKILIAGARSPGWDMSDNIDRAISQGHSESVWLPILAAVVAGEKDLAELDTWPAWTTAR